MFISLNFAIELKKGIKINCTISLISNEYIKAVAPLGIILMGGRMHAGNSSF